MLQYEGHLQIGRAVRSALDSLGGEYQRRRSFERAGMSLQAAPETGRLVQIAPGAIRRKNVRIRGA